jgi:hypothetical protein
MYRGPMFTGKDRQTAIEYPAPIPIPSYGPYLTPWAVARAAPQPELMSRKERPMGKRFTALDNFTSEDLRCEYVAGLSYEARDEDELLLSLLPQWIEEGKVREGGPEAIVTGGDAAEDETEPAPKTKKR